MREVAGVEKDGDDLCETCTYDVRSRLIGLRYPCMEMTESVDIDYHEEKGG